MKIFNRKMLAGLLATTALISVALPVRAEKVLAGQVATERVHSLTTEIDWQTNLKKAEEQAGKEGKLIFWLHILGHLDGAT